jgi:phosphoribosylformylglycinamidine synthase PurS subunit
MQAKVYVTLKKGVHDPQGETVSRTLKTMGYGEVGGVRIGKYIEVDLKGVEGEEARTRLTEMCEKLLANTVIESYRIEI